MTTTTTASPARWVWRSASTRAVTSRASPSGTRRVAVAAVLPAFSDGSAVQSTRNSASALPPTDFRLPPMGRSTSESIRATGAPPPSATLIETAPPCPVGEILARNVVAPAA